MHSINQNKCEQIIEEISKFENNLQRTRETLNTKENETQYHVYGTVYRNYYLSDTVKNTSE